MSVRSWLPSTMLAAWCGCGPASPDPQQVGDLDGFLRDLPGWTEVSPPVAEADGPTGAPPTADEELGSEGSAWRCTTTPYRIDTNPDGFAMVSPDVAVLWPGALVRGASHLAVGSLELLAVDREHRAPLGLSVQGGGVLGIPGGVSTVVEEPVGSTVREGINQLVAQALAADVAVGAGKSSFTSVETHSTEQSLLSLGFDARYLGASVSGSLASQRTADEHTVTATFVQTLFTVAVDPPESPAGVFADDVTPEDLVRLGVGDDDLPLYIDSVSYGRMLLVSITGRASADELSASLEAGYSGFGVDVNGYAAAELQSTLQSSEVHVFALGGPNAGVEALLTSGELASYFDVPLAINQVEPISFTVRNLGDNRLATVAATTDYAVRVCEEVGAALPSPTHWWPADGDELDVIGDHDFSGFGGGYAAGAWDRAWAFDGDNDYLLNHLAGLPVPSDGPFTLSAWVRTLDDDRTHTLVSQLGQFPTAGDFALRVAPGGVLQLFRRPIDGDTAVELVESEVGAVPQGVWTHVAGAYGPGPDGESVLRVYVDGALAGDTPVPSTYGPARGTTYFRVGAGELGPDEGTLRFPLHGELDELQVWDTALSSDELLVQDASFTPWTAAR
ncbi:MAG: thiol-activated cytolysin family protein [Alphaproteobacteria bacterium]|nr:thiol-activated cytolysin family protein [Alphaproteobacteria bacterium]